MFCVCAGVTKNFDTGVIFQCYLMRSKLNKDHSPLKIDPDHGILIIKPILNSTVNTDIRMN